jgi:acyl carrier protein
LRFGGHAKKPFSESLYEAFAISGTLKFEGLNWGLIPQGPAMSIESIVRSEFEQVAREQEKVLSGLSDDTVLLDSGLDSLCFAIIVARLEDRLGVDPFTASEDVYFPVTLGDFIKFYQDAAA